MGGVRTEDLARIRYNAAMQARKQKLNILIKERNLLLNKLYISASDIGGYNS